MIQASQEGLKFNGNVILSVTGKAIHVKAYYRPRGFQEVEASRF